MRCLLWFALVPVFGCGLDEIEEEPDHATVEQTAAIPGDYFNQVMLKKPVGYWRLGETSGSTMLDSSGFGRHGAYEGFYALGAGGALARDTNRAVYFPSFAGYPQTYPNSRGTVSGSHRALSLNQDFDFYSHPQNASTASTWGAAPDGQSWTCDSTCSGNFYGRGPSGAYINPGPSPATYQQTRPTTLTNGEMQIRVSWTKHPVGGPVAPVALVARYIDSANYVAAQLVEDQSTNVLRLQIVEVFNGVTNVRDNETVGTYSLGVWWMVRFRFDGTQLKARAWNEGLTQPASWQAEATIGAPSTGRVAIRSSNQFSNSRPRVYFTDFWVQQAGFTTSLFIWAESSQYSDKVYPFGKSHHEDAAFADSHEYYWRYETNTRKLKPYIFNSDGGKGAGVDLTQDVGSLVPGRWHHAVVTFDNGDWRDPTASVEGFLNGRHVGLFDQHLYRNIAGCITPCNSDYKCTNTIGEEQNCWLITPRRGNQALKIGSVGGSGDVGFNGVIDEVAVFDRVLSSSEIRELYVSSCQPHPDGPLRGLTATASSVEGNWPGFTPDKAVDFDTTTRWSSNYTDNESLTIDLGSQKPVQRILVDWEVAFAEIYDIMLSDNGIVFTPFQRVTKTSEASDLVDIYKVTRYIRIQGIKRGTGFGYSIWEVQVHGCDAAWP